MKKTLSLLSIALITSFLITSCSGNVKGLNTVGDWHHEISRNMGGYQISQKSKLTIVRNGTSDYEYQLETITIDAMYGGKPKRSNTSGIFEKNTSANKWRFSGGDFGERGGYIQIPSDNWDNYKPSDILIGFASGRGNPMTFTRR